METVVERLSIKVARLSVLQLPVLHIATLTI